MKRSKGVLEMRCKGKLIGNVIGNDVLTVCPICKEHTYITLEDIQKYFRWRRGEGFIQDMFPELSDDQREQLLSGTCPKCWNETMKEEE